jgi:putative Holliday junction resolvase
MRVYPVWLVMPEPGNPAALTLLAFDFGRRRIGVAVGNTWTRCAQALTAIESTSDADRISRIEQLVDTWKPYRLIVGLPLSVNGQAHAMTGQCRRFGHRLERRFGLDVDFADERYTSTSAQTLWRDRIREEGRHAPIKSTIDATSAALILQTWFDEHAS